MAAAFVPNQNVNAGIAAEALGHVFAAGSETWLRAWDRKYTNIQNR